MAYDRKQGQHQVAQSSRPDYRLVVGRAEVPVGAPRTFAILDPARAATLRAWTATLIPAAGKRPDAGSVGAPEYIDATVQLVPSLRSTLVHAIDDVERIARESAGKAFGDGRPEERESVLQQFQALDPDAFSMVSDFTYEAYYGHPQVQAAIETETGWRAAGPMKGAPMPPFPESRLARVRALPPRYRTAEPAEKKR